MSHNTNRLTPHNTIKLYRTWFMDSSRWQHYQPRADDIIISAYPKSGTTWLQRIVSLLVLQHSTPCPLMDISPWIDCRFMRSSQHQQRILQQQTHRRFMKSHLPFDGLPYYPQVKYLHITRDPRDVCLSFHHHCLNLSSTAIAAINHTAPEMGVFPACPEEPQLFWKQWFSRGLAPDYNDGYPEISYFHHERSYWDARDLENVLLVHYQQLLADPTFEIQRIADFLNIPIPTDFWPELLRASTLDAMRHDGNTLLAHLKDGFTHGAESFFKHGNSGRWAQIYPQPCQTTYNAACQQLDSDHLRWIQQTINYQAPQKVINTQHPDRI